MLQNICWKYSNEDEAKTAGRRKSSELKQTPGEEGKQYLSKNEDM